MSSQNDNHTLASIIKAVDNGIMILDESLTIHFWNHWLEKRTELNAELTLGIDLLKIAPYIKANSLKRKIKSCLQLDSPTYLHASTSNYLLQIPLMRGVSKVFEFMQQDITIVPHDMDKRQVLLIVYDRTAVEESNKKLQHTIQDISELNKDLERYNTVIDANINAVKTDASGQIIYASKSLCHLSGYTNKQFMGWDLKQFFVQSEGDGHKDLIAAIRSTKSWSGELSNLNTDGNIYWTNTSLTPIFSDNGELVSFTVLFHDITDKKLIEKLSSLDSLTGIYNRKKFNESLTHHINTSNRYLPALSLILLDIDHFKRVNDGYGHLCGDQVLQDLAKLVQKTIRKSDIFARWGGEEFVILMSHTTLGDAGRLAEKLCLTIAGHTFECVENVTASFGVAQYEIGTERNKFIAACDEALYESKHNGRNQVTQAKPPDEEN